ncbi:uncharacterized protein LOC114289767 [Camellia sinensis]|uniref:uncharacterized protein LOC114289767 n=1 Tax=Camellia sinensis TaxID=4442 RepID=UPI0010365EC9|nr:uncharacterized protein LOC114289767 [Camellia sinensis]
MNVKPKPLQSSPSRLSLSSHLRSLFYIDGVSLSSLSHLRLSSLSLTLIHLRSDQCAATLSSSVSSLSLSVFSSLISLSRIGDYFCLFVPRSPSQIRSIYSCCLPLSIIHRRLDRLFMSSTMDSVNVYRNGVAIGMEMLVA